MLQAPAIRRYFLPILTAVSLFHLHAQVQASPPEDLSNFQNEYVCDLDVRIVRPRGVSDVQDAVRLHDSLQAVAEGHSWNGPFFCTSSPADQKLPTGPEKLTENDTRANVTKTVSAQQGPSTDKDPIHLPASASASTAANVVMSTIRPMKISVNEQNETVTVDAGVKVIDLLNYLGNYITEAAPSGWTLGAFPWFVYQSIGGAVATNTHGSSLKHSSLSNQVVAMTVVLADGSLRTFTSESDPFLMRALRVGAWKLGMITSLEMRIVKEQPVKRTLRVLPSSGFLKLISEAQDHYKELGTLPSWLDETEFFWITQKNQFMMVSFTRGDDEDPATRQEVIASYTPESTTLYNTSKELLTSVTFVEQLPLLSNVTFDPTTGLSTLSQEYLQNITEEMNSPLDSNLTQYYSSSSDATGGGAQNLVALGTSWKAPEPRDPIALYAAPAMATSFLEISRVGVFSIAGNATKDAHRSYLYQPKEMLANIQTVLYDQYEVAIRVDIMADCFASLLDLVYGDDLDGANETERVKDKGFRTAPLIRFVGKEDGLLSYTGDVPRMFVNIEDYVYYNRGRKTNEAFKKVVAHFRSHPSCGGGPGLGARMHWGKAGWPDPGCWHGDKEFPDTWCDFGCAVLALDPTSKFADRAPDRWNWEGANLEQCCSPQGYRNSSEDSRCTCSITHARKMEDCPPPPFYTNR